MSVIAAVLGDGSPFSSFTVSSFSPEFISLSTVGGGAAHFRILSNMLGFYL